LEQLKEKVLVVDDEVEIASQVCEYLEMAGFSCISASSGDEALKMVRGEQVFVLISDFNMPIMNGLELIKTLRESKPLLPTVLMTGHADKHIVVEALRSGVNEFFDKPLDFSMLEARVRAFSEFRFSEIKRDAQELEDLKRVFVEESKTILADLDPLLTGLEDAVISAEDLNVIYRKVHTLKGSAGSVPGSGPLVRLAHSFETVLSGLKDRKITMSPQMLTTMLSSLELLGVCVQAIDAGAELPETSGLHVPLPPSATIRTCDC